MANHSHTTSWIALIVSIFALIISLFIWVNVDEQIVVDDRIPAEVRAELRETQLELARLRAASELALLRLEANAEEGVEELEQDVALIRDDLAQAYTEAELEASQQWQNLERDMQNLEQALREGTADALGGMESLISALRQDIATDED